MCNSALKLRILVHSTAVITIGLDVKKRYLRVFITFIRNTFLKELRRHQFLSSSVGSFEPMADAADVRLLRAVVASDAHVLHQFFPPVAKRTYNLRPRKHPFLLPPKDDRYFVSRVLFKL